MGRRQRRRLGNNDVAALDRPLEDRPRSPCAVTAHPVGPDGDSAKVTSTTASGNGASGLFVGGNSASIGSTTASGNQVYGIDLSGDQGALKGNRADGNSFAGGVSDGFGLGIRVENFTTAPVGTNLARANDDPAECDPGSLC
jgi:hypothetical protein